MSDLKALPDIAAIAEASQINVLDAEGKPVAFRSLFKDKKTIVIFIRHFFCGSCQAYVCQLASVSQENLAAADVNLIVIGCGDWQPIQSYKELTDFKGAIYAEPTRKLYHALGMNIENLNSTPADQKKPSYIKTGLFINVMQSIWNGPLKNPSLIGKQGPITQLGGEFIFGPGDVCTFASRMKHTEDHVEVADLMKIAGVSYKE